MNLSDIQTLISNDEHRELELKKSTGELKDAMHSACAFLNTDGGWLVFGVTPENIKLKHDSRPFNPVIAEILYKTSWLESWGSGVGRMVDACVQQHLPEPYYEIRPDGVAIIFKRVPKNQNDVTEKWPEKWPEKARAIISLIESESGNVSVAQMETRLGIGHTTIKKILKAMQEAEMLRYEGPANGGHWEICRDAIHRV